MYKSIDELVERIDERNSDGKISTLIGVSIDKCFINSVANINGTDLTKYKIIRRDDFAVSLMQVSRDSKIPIARLKDYDQAIMSPAYPIFRVRDTSVILPEYLEMWFMRPEFDREAAFIAVGGVRGSMPWEEFAKMRLPVPSLEKQHQVVRAYQIVADRIAIKRRINDNLLASMEAILDKYYTDAFGDTKLSQISEFPIPDDWKIYQLSDLAECQSGYAFYKDGYNDDGIRIVDLGNINRNAEFIQAKTDKYILPERVSAQKYDKFRLYKNDLVMVMTDRKSTMELLGKTGRIYTKEPLLLNQRVYRIRTNSLTSYLYVYLNSERVHIFHKSRALGTAQKYVNNGDINIIPIVLPPKQILEKLLKLFDNSWTIMEHNLNEMNALSVLQDQITLMLSSH